METDPNPARFPRLRALLLLLLALAFGFILVAAMTWFVIGSAPRSRAVAIADGIRVAEFAALPDEDSYPAALAIDADGTLYTGSYQSGALWSINPAGAVSEIQGSRERIGSVSGLAVDPDNALFILDRIAPLNAEGAIIWRYASGELDRLFDIQAKAFLGKVLPDDITIDIAGRVYISDRLGHVLRFSAAGEPLGSRGGAYWWIAPCSEGCEITGIAYDRANDALLIADPVAEAVYRVNITDGSPGDSVTLIRGADQKSDYGFDGIALSPRGEVYLALLNWNRVARLEAGELVMLAKDFRGASDIAYDAARDRLYVTNWNQFGLAFGTRPQLPFAIDVIDLSPGSA
ncbi:MAG: hypothetical protein OXG68_04175 [Chloroflexi bacterium]|nr:hypothetical protein [Chloroflexota bacterium]